MTMLASASPLGCWPWPACYERVLPAGGGTLPAPRGQPGPQRAVIAQVLAVLLDGLAKPEICRQRTC